MGRKQDLMKESDRLLRRSRVGTPRTRKERRSAIHRMIRDLVRIGVAPRKLQSIHRQHFLALVNDWRQRHVALKTMTNQLGILRTFSKWGQWEWAIPSNQALGLHPPQKTSTRQTATLENPIPRVAHAFTKSILAFQWYFGLTKTEAARVWVDYATQAAGQLNIDRALATNGKERIVPIVSSKQAQTLEHRKQLLGHHATLTDIVPETTLLGLYKADLLIAGLDPHFPYRRQYAKTRLATLSTQLTQTEALKRLQSELGIASKHRVLALL